MKVVVSYEDTKKTFGSLQRAEAVEPPTEQSLIAIDAFKGEQDMVGFGASGNRIKAKFIYEKVTA